ncbi:MAG: DUF4147 domain-containing protein [Kofleriaceae bacterium]
MTPFQELERIFREAVAGIEPARLVDIHLRSWQRLQPPIARPNIAFAIGVSAIAMARGCGPVSRGIVVAREPADVPAGWELVIGGEDERGVAAGIAIVDLIASVRRDDKVLALCSAGPMLAQHELLSPSALAVACEAPINGIVMSDGETTPLIQGIAIATPYAFADAVDTVFEAGEIGGPHQPTTLQELLKDTAEREAAQIAGALSWPRCTTAGVIAGPKHGRCRRLAKALIPHIRKIDRDSLAVMVLATSGDDGDGIAGGFVDGKSDEPLDVITGPTGLALGDVMIAL